MDSMATDLMTGVLRMPFFNIGLGREPVVPGVILMTLRGWDAVTNPIMGISPTTPARPGAGGLGDRGRAVYLTVVGVAFFASFACWSMPYCGMQLEMTPNYDERTRLSA